MTVTDLLARVDASWGTFRDAVNTYAHYGEHRVELEAALSARPA